MILGNKRPDGGFNVKVGGHFVPLPYDGVPRVKQVCDIIPVSHAGFVPSVILYKIDM